MDKVLSEGNWRPTSLSKLTPERYIIEVITSLSVLTLSQLLLKLIGLLGLYTRYHPNKSIKIISIDFELTHLGLKLPRSYFYGVNLLWFGDLQIKIWIQFLIMIAH